MKITGKAALTVHPAAEAYVASNAAIYKHAAWLTARQVTAGATMQPTTRRNS